MRTGTGGVGTGPAGWRAGTAGWRVGTGGSSLAGRAAVLGVAGGYLLRGHREAGGRGRQAGVQRVARSAVPSSSRGRRRAPARSRSSPARRRLPARRRRRAARPAPATNSVGRFRSSVVQSLWCASLNCGSILAQASSLTRMSVSTNPSQAISSELGDLRSPRR